MLNMKNIFQTFVFSELVSQKENLEANFELLTVTNNNYNVTVLNAYI